MEVAPCASPVPDTKTMEPARVNRAVERMSLDDLSESVINEWSQTASN